MAHRALIRLCRPGELVLLPVEQLSVDACGGGLGQLPLITSISGHPLVGVPRTGRIMQSTLQFLLRPEPGMQARQLRKIMISKGRES
jgi:hypothetical protein